MIIKIFLLTSITMIATVCNTPSNGSNTPGGAGLKHKVVAEGLSHPWEILWGPDNHIWITERDGEISRVNPATGTVSQLISIADVEDRGEGGLLGMALHPEFNTNPYVYVGYNYSGSSGYREKIVRLTYINGKLSQPVILLDGIAAAGIHNGCRLFIYQNKLFITTGDAANQSLPQQNNSLNGKVLRLNLDGAIPADNPFPNNPVWSTGHRNAQGLVVANNIMYVSEHGPSSDDEINIVEKGRNYGWPEVEGMCDNNEMSFCNANNVVEPIYAWTPTTAVCGMDFYNSSLIPEWKNSLLLTTLKDQTLHIIKLDAAGKKVLSVGEYLSRVYGRLRDVCISPDGKVYVSTSNGGNDKIIEITK